MSGLGLKLRVGALVGATLIGGTAIVGSVAASRGEGEGHTPVTLCHWVPAHGGSYIVITVDDDGSSGNKNQQGHAGHENDIIPAPAEGCPAAGDATPTPSPD